MAYGKIKADAVIWDNGGTDTEVAVSSMGASLSNAEDGSGNNFEFNSGFGSNGVAYGCRCWVNFNGTGTIAIRGSGNVSSLVDRDTGRYSVNMSTAMPDANYAAITESSNGSDDDRAGACYISTTSQFRLSASDQGGTDNAYGDTVYVFCAVFR